jgi:sulfatase maturation enzyme AslB (radical SAM superfamily)
MICFDAFKNLNIVNQNNKLATGPCCLAPAAPVSKIDFVNSRYLNSIRQAWENNTFPPACTNCKTVEQRNQVSRRMGVNKWYSDHNHDNTDVELLRIDYWTGNTCNLRCVICGPANSSSWQQELKLPNREQVTNKFWNDLDIGALQYVHFNGGEPLLSKEHVSFLNAVPNKAQVHLNYNTNATIRPSTELLELWGKFKLVQLDFSIDDLGERFEYQRFPAKWDEVVSNLEWYVRTMPTNCLFSVNTTVSILNQHNLPNLQHWLDNNFSKNRLGDLIEHRQQPVHGLLNGTNPNKIFDFLDECDKRRGTNWRLVFPELTKSI